MARTSLFSFVLLFGTLSVLLPTTQSLAQISPDSGIFNWDPDSLEIIDSEDVTFSTDIDFEGNIALIPVFSEVFSVSSRFACHLQSYDRNSSVLVFGTIWEDGTSDFDTVVATRFNGAVSLGLIYTGIGNHFDDPGFWSDYWYFLTGGSAPADPAWLNYGSEAAFGVAAVSLTVAGGIVILGPAAGGGVAGGGALGGGTTLIGSQAIVAPNLGAGTYTAIVINGQVYVARFHFVAYQLAGGTGVETFYGFATIDAAGKVIKLFN